MAYHSVVIHPDLPGGRIAATLEVNEFVVRFTYGDKQTVELPINGLDLSLGGSNNNLIFISHKNKPGWSFYTDEGKFLSEPALKNTEMGRQIARKRAGNNRLVYTVAFSVLGVIALAIFFFVFFYSSIVKGVANQVPPSFDNETGEKLFTMVTENRTLVKDSALLEELKKQVAPLVGAVKDTAFKFTFYIMKDPTMNAFALPGGHIVIHTGLLEKADGWNEVLGVLGHEISHVTCRHHVRGVISNMGAFYVLSLFVGDAGAIGSIILQTGAQLESLMYSREFETESDDRGWDYLVKAGIHPGGMITFFEKLEKEYGLDEVDKETQEKLNFLSTHPATSERIKMLKEKEKMLSNASSLKKESGDYAAFKKQLQEQIK